MAELSSEHKALLIQVLQTGQGQIEFPPFTQQDESLWYPLAKAHYVRLEHTDDETLVFLSEKGYEAAELAYHEQNVIHHVTIPFDSSQPRHIEILVYLSEVADTAEKKANLLADLFQLHASLGTEGVSSLLDLHEALERGDIDALMNAYPESRATIQQMIRASVDSQMMAQEQHRINHLLGEIGELKAMLTKQAEHQQANPRKAAIPEEVDDDAPIPPPKAVVMRPVLPHTPQGQPKQLSVPQFDLPKDDEESEALFVVKKDEDAGKRASENFIQALERLQK